MENKWLDSVIEGYRTFFGDDDAEVVFDVGTRDGDDAEFLREKLNAGRTYAIDANPFAVNQTRAAYPHIEVIETAVSNYNGTAQFLQINDPDKNFVGTSTLDLSKEIVEHDIFAGKGTHITVPVTRLDKVLDDLGLTDSLIDVMKIDVETYTYEALLGLGKKLQDVKVFHLETERKYYRPEHRNNIQIAALMRPSGFWLYDLSYEWGNGIQDQVWINKKLSAGPFIFGQEKDESTLMPV